MKNMLLMQDKQKQWDTITATFQLVRDKLGKPIDHGIMETVVALNAFHIHTTASCEGHLQSGIAAPWVDISLKETDATKAIREEAEMLWKTIMLKEENGQHTQADQLMMKYRELIRRLQIPAGKDAEKLAELLSEYYQARQASFLTRLIISSAALTYRLESQGATFQAILDEKQRAERLHAYQEEMSAFTKFLKNRYFEQINGSQ